MGDLERELRDLSAWLDTPDPPDVTARVRVRLSTPASRRRRWRSLAAAVLVALLVAVLPPTRAAIADVVTGLLRFAGVSIATGPAPTPPGGGASPLPGQRVVALDEAQRAVRFPIRLPATLGPPGQVLVADPDATGRYRVATLLYDGARCASTRSTVTSTWPSTRRSARRGRTGSRSTATSPSGSTAHTCCPTWTGREGSAGRPPDWPPRP